MINPRSLLAQQDVINTTNSNETMLPLSAAQGRKLQQEIDSLITQGGVYIKKQFPNTANGIFAVLPIGLLGWDTSNSQPYFNLTDSTVLTVDLFNNTNNLIGGLPNFVTDQDDFSVTTGMDYYFTTNGAINAQFDLNEAPVIGRYDASFETSNPIQFYNLQLEVRRLANNNIIVTGKFITYNAADLFAIQMEAAGNYSASTYPFSFGGKENTEFSGVVFPIPAIVKQISYRLDSLPSSPISLDFYVDETFVDSSVIIPSTGVTNTIDLDTPFSINEGEKLNVFTPTGTFEFHTIQLLVVGEYIN